MSIVAGLDVGASSGLGRSSTSLPSVPDVDAWRGGALFRRAGPGRLHFDPSLTKISSSAIEPRATVFSTGGRSERPSPKNSEGESGRFFGWLAMSCRRYSQPPPTIKEAAAQAAARKREVLEVVKGHLGDVVRVDFLEKARAFLQMEVGVL